MSKSNSYLSTIHKCSKIIRAHVFIYLLTLNRNDELCSSDMVSTVSQKLFSDIDNKLKTIQDVLNAFSSFEDLDFINTSFNESELTTCVINEGDEYRKLYLRKGNMEIIQQISNDPNHPLDRDLFLQMFIKLVVQSPG